MPIPALIMWAVVFAVGVPSAWRNPTAAALVVAKIAGWGIYKITGDNLPVEYYLFPDIFVLAVIFAKQEFCNQRPYRNTWHQLKCVLLERSPADRIVMLLFVLCWFVYIADMHPFHQWWSLWGITIAQFFAAWAESFNSYRRDADAADCPPEDSGTLLVAYGGRLG